MMTREQKIQFKSHHMKHLESAGFIPLAEHLRKTIPDFKKEVERVASRRMLGNRKFITYYLGQGEIPSPEEEHGLAFVMINPLTSQRVAIMIPYHDENDAIIEVW